MDRIFFPWFIWLCYSYNTLFQLLEENIVTFVKTELKMIKKDLSSDKPECFQSPHEELFDGEDEEQRKSSREAFLKITLHFLRRMKQEKLAECLQSSKNISLYGLDRRDIYRLYNRKLKNSHINFNTDDNSIATRDVMIHQSHNLSASWFLTHGLTQTLI